jgi:hypothetical protein
MNATDRLFERYYFGNPGFLNGTSEILTRPSIVPNTRGVLKRLAREARLEVLELRMIEKEPSYAKSSVFLFWPLLCYERIVNSHPLFQASALIFSVSWPRSE